MFNKKIILGSSSPRRLQLIQQLGLTCEVRKKEVDEKYPSSLSPYDVPQFLAKKKAIPLQQSIREDEVLVTSDTVVIKENKILGKPTTHNEAIQMLTNLSGDSNEVVTGVFCYHPHKSRTFTVKTNVLFSNLSMEEIDHYIQTFKPFDKAGAYGIQEWIGMIGVEKIEGCFYNVMGLPTNTLWKVLNSTF